MDLFKSIRQQMDAVRLPLFAVTLTAIQRPNTPMLLMLHWHGFRRENLPARVEQTELRSVPCSALQVNERWVALSTIDAAMLDSAWRLGAWELARDEKRACNTAGASDQEALECRQAFGDTLLHGEQEQIGAEAPDRDDMLTLGARVGYVRWQFRPVHGGVWREAVQDDTLSADGSRQPPCPVQSPTGTALSRSRYGLGNSHRLIIL